MNDCIATAEPKTRHSRLQTEMSGLPIYSVTPFTMLDFPGKTACIVWFSGCNMRCGYCHNPLIVKGKGRSDIRQLLAFLEKRRGLLDGVVLSGGEASLYTGLEGFVEQVRAMGYAIKLDTNGTRPCLIKRLLVRGWLDYVALDYKAPPEKFKSITGINRFSAFEETLSLLCSQGEIPFEVRTTVHTDLLDEDDIAAIMADLETKTYRGIYYIQNFRADNDRPTLGLLPPQKRILRPDLLPTTLCFSLGFRNF